MLNLLKWNSLDFVHRYFWMFIVAAASLVLAAVVPDGKGFTNALLIFSSGVLGGIFFPACIVLALYQCFGWLRHNSALLELSLPVSAWKQMLSRVIIALVVNILACLGIMVLMLLYGKYSSGTVEMLSLDHIQTVAGLTLFLILGDMTVLISYMISRSMGLTRLWAALITTMLSTILMMLIAVFVVYVMVWTRVLMLPQIGADNLFTLDGNLQITSFVPALLSSLWIILLEYLGSSLLLKYSFQVD
jgi:hypothetical protein